MWQPKRPTRCDTGSNTVVATIAVGGAPQGVALTPDGAFVYVTNSGTTSVSVINTGTRTVVATIDVEAFPLGVAIGEATTSAR